MNSKQLLNLKVGDLIYGQSLGMVVEVRHELTLPYYIDWLTKNQNAIHAYALEELQSCRIRYLELRAKVKDESRNKNR